MKNKFFLIAILAMCIVFSACSSNSNAPSNNEENTSKEHAPDKIVLDHAFGQTILDKKPERVATIAWGNHDVALALGIVPVGLSKANYGVSADKGVLPWTEEKIKELNGKAKLFDDLDGLNFEAISNSKPDVILAGYSGITKEDYDTLSKIAPVAAYKSKPWQTLWRDMIKIDSKALGMEKEGDELIKNTEARISKELEKHPEIKGKKVLFTMINAADTSKFWIYTSKDSRANYLTDLGLVFPESLKEFESEDSFAKEISAEEANKINDADVIITYGDDKTLEALQKDPLLGKMNAIKNGAVAVIPDNTPLAASCTPTPLSINYTIEEYLNLLGNACKNAK
ncbi:iron-siderophore ABC transporter substrate-binding protein [Streptococcus pneumoniae]|uniref:Iron ABC transporter substrate-binding protein n=1 Tax=Streptococcus pneumoniae TaxID=1313 RepID=A0A0T7ZE18_STREE|nr:iron-siderophore ABC transporter substrate-binding protein [Streptococcus pneumoniae]MDG7108607.1 iron-siderophore ABC transporter substrate-binding protein [Streptococcus pneumoniae]MDG7112812.1 iron-siderophore ABC transporter substrate-binding protein [Streptococcus pneumoniae]MDG9060169.1 iron-siderophore ABC transporter substrate-binding protein [Streptococcus pneumoniae]MDG9426846.1 iron-siderophore ABC transporter substrate-binding protein [Streptococcus pneumoniae]MDT5998483.1 iron-